MKKLLLLFTLQILSLCAYAYSEEVPLENPLSNIEISVTGLQNTNGNIVACLWRESDPGFPKCDQGKAFQKQTTTATKAKIVFTDVPKGIYAISLFHDEKSTGKIDLNFMGMPRSGLGVSGKFTKPPSFSKSKIELPTEKPILIKVNYMGR